MWEAEMRGDVRSGTWGREIGDAGTTEHPRTPKVLPLVPVPMSLSPHPHPTFSHRQWGARKLPIRMTRVLGKYPVLHLMHSW